MEGVLGLLWSWGSLGSGQGLFTKSRCPMGQRQGGEPWGVWAGRGGGGTGGPRAAGGGGHRAHPAAAGRGEEGRHEPAVGEAWAAGVGRGGGSFAMRSTANSEVKKS